MLTEQKIRKILSDKIKERKNLNKHYGEVGNKGHHLPYLAVECDLLKKILGDADGVE